MHDMQTFFIRNRKNQRIAIIVEPNEHARGLAFIMHGLGGNKEQPHLQTIAQACQECGYSRVRFDTTNTYGESDGAYEDATVTNYYEDLEDVIAWSRTQAWFLEPFVLFGHSLGAMCVALYAEKYPDQVRALAPLGTVVSGTLSLHTHKHAIIAEEWKRTGWREEMSESVPGRVKRLKWSHMEDRLRYNLLDHIDRLTMPVLMIVGSEDDSTPVDLNAYCTMRYQARRNSMWLMVHRIHFAMNRILQPFGNGLYIGYIGLLY